MNVPPAYQAHRAVLLVLVLVFGALIAIGVLVAAQPVWATVMSMIEGVRGSVW